MTRMARMARVRVAEPLRFLLAPGNRAGEVTVPVDEGAALVHVVESLGVPRTEIGELRERDDVIEVLPVPRPQRIAAPRFVLDVHLGTLARRMRLLGVDTARSTSTAWYTFGARPRPRGWPAGASYRARSSPASTSLSRWKAASARDMRAASAASSRVTGWHWRLT